MISQAIRLDSKTAISVSTEKLHEILDGISIRHSCVPDFRKGLISFDQRILLKIMNGLQSEKRTIPIVH